MTFDLLIIHNYDRMSSITRLHTATWDYFTSFLPNRFICSPEVVKEAIMTDINDLVQEFSRTSSDVGASFFAMHCLQRILEVCFDIFSDCVDLNANKISQKLANPYFWNYSAQPACEETPKFKAKFKILYDGYREMFDQSLSKSKDLGDMLKFLPGVVVQKPMSMDEMADIYRIKSDLLGYFVKSIIEPLRYDSCHHIILDDYLSGFLQDRDRSGHYYCDPMLQHIFICRHFLSLLDRLRSNDLGLQS